MDRKYAGDLPSANGVSIDVIPSDPFPDQQADMHVRVLVQAGSDYPKCQLVIGRSNGRTFHIRPLRESGPTSDNAIRTSNRSLSSSSTVMSVKELIFSPKNAHAERSRKETMALLHDPSPHPPTLPDASSLSDESVPKTVKARIA
jgi:hypothetical protein